jgi:hypothetical protein
LHGESDAVPCRETFQVRLSIPIAKFLGTLRQDEASESDKQASSNEAHNALIVVFRRALGNKTWLFLINAVLGKVQY